MERHCPPGGGASPPLRKCGLCTTTSRHSVQYGKSGERVTLQWRDPTNITSLRWSRSTSTVIRHVDSMYPWYHVMRMAPYFCGCLLKTHNLCLIMRKRAGKKQLRDLLPNTWPVILKTVKVIKSKKSFRNRQNQEEPKETWLMKFIWCPETEKRCEVKGKGIWINCGLWLMITYQYQFINCDKWGLAWWCSN